MIILLILVILIVAAIIAALLLGANNIAVVVFAIWGFISSLGGDVEAISRNYPSERMSPIKHTVSGYTRIQNGREVNVRSYTRGSR